ncbi:MAG: hypothetical protein JW750_08035 [Anaerolineaceae bacterium]|nr:hypothetical protein [Anaerolineaceae bacterium]
MKKRLHLISHTHWDREWYQPFQEFRLRLIHLIDRLLKILAEDPEYRFFMLDGQTIVLDDYLAMRPQNEPILREYIQQGRILIGPFHILPDEFLVSPEATIRNLLQGERTAQKFGQKMKVGYIPDPFGHIGQMPQILLGFEIEFAAFQRGLSTESCELWWESPDGSRVLTSYLRDGYSNAAWLTHSNPEQFAREISRLRDSLEPYTAVNDLLLMHGTDHMEPEENTSALINFTNQHLERAELAHSTLPDYFEALQKEITEKELELPLVKGELRSSQRHPLLPGVFSARMWIKQRNHYSEQLLERWVEPFSTFANLVNPEHAYLRHPAEMVRAAWRLLMENHPHDSICGCSVDQVHAEMRPRFDQVDQIGEELTRQSLFVIADTIDTAAGAPDDAIQALIVFNPTQKTRSGVVEVEFCLPRLVQDFEIIDESGAVCPHQLEGTDSEQIFNGTLTPDDFAAMVAEISEGRIANYAIQNFYLERRGNEVFLDVVMLPNGAPNKEVWKNGQSVLQKHFADSSITLYHVHARSTISNRTHFFAHDVPGMGWRKYYVRARINGEPTPIKINPLVRWLTPLALRLSQTEFGSALMETLDVRSARAPWVIENECLRVEVEKNGSLTITDKRDDLVYQGMNWFISSGDAGDEYNYSPPESDSLQTAKLCGVHLHRGPIEQILEVHLALDLPEHLTADRKSRSMKWTAMEIISSVTLVAGSGRVDITTQVNNTARDHRLQATFSMPFAVDAADYDGHFQVVRRAVTVPDADDGWIEQPRPETHQRAFMDITDGVRGLMIANRGLPEAAVHRVSENHSEAALTLLRCVGWLSRDDLSTRKGHAGPFLATPDAQEPGWHTFEYSLIPHTGDWREVMHEAYAFTAPMRAICTQLHGGALPDFGSFITVDGFGFVLSSIKEAEDGSGWIARGVNLDDQPHTVRLKPLKQFTRVTRVNLLEHAEQPLSAEADGSVVLNAAPHQIVTLKFE